MIVTLGDGVSNLKLRAIAGCAMPTRWPPSALSKPTSTTYRMNGRKSYDYKELTDAEIIAQGRAATKRRSRERVRWTRASAVWYDHGSGGETLMVLTVTASLASCACHIYLKEDAQTGEL